ncbi:MAG: RHS repeat-associated protein [Phenylobacterium sp.]|jgi:RHS repeat-associated protein
MDNWRIRCLTSADTGTGAEGFEATSPEGVTYTFDRYKLVKGIPLIKGKTVNRFHAFMQVSTVQDRFGNTVTYHYDNLNRLTSIVGHDLGDSNDRVITIAYRTIAGQTSLIESVTANQRTWSYGYDTNASGSYVRSLQTVTRPDATAWQYDLGSMSQQSPRMISGYEDACDVDSYNNNTIEGSITHPYGVKGTFAWNTVIHGRSAVPALRDGTTSDRYYQDCYATVALSSKTLTGPGLTDMTWSYVYSQNKGVYADEVASGLDLLTGTIPSNINAVDYKSTTVTVPDGSKTVHYFNRDWGKVYDGKAITVDYYDTNANTLLKRVENTWSKGNMVGNISLLKENNLPTIYQAWQTDVVQSLYGAATTRYTTNYGDFNLYGQSRWSHGSNTTSTAHQYSKTTIVPDTTNWVLNLPTQQKLSADNVNWELVSETAYYSKTGAYKSLPYQQLSFGEWVKRFSEYQYGNVGKIEFNTTMDDDEFRWQKFADYRRGKARTITLPGRYDASAPMNATLVVDDNGWVTDVTSFNQDETSYGHDSMGRVTSINPPGSYWSGTTFSFGKVDNDDIGGDVVADMYKRIQTRGGFSSTTYYDALLQPVLVKTDGGNDLAKRYQRSEFNAYGKPLFSAYPSASATESEGIRYAFDGLQRPTTTTQTATGVSSRKTYHNGHKTAVSNYAGYTTTTTYLAYGEPATQAMTRVESPQGVITSQTYNLYGGVEMISQGGVTQSHLYNTRQQVCKVVRPDTGVTAYKQDILGQLEWVAQGATGNTIDCDEGAVQPAEKTVYSTDNLGARKTVDYQDDSANLIYEYDRQGNLVTLTAGEVITVYGYNKLDMLETENLSIDGKAFNLVYRYNPDTALDSTDYPNGQTIDMAPNGFGEPTTAGSYATAGAYHSNGQLKGFTYGNDIRHSVLLNDRQLPKEIKGTRKILIPEEESRQGPQPSDADDIPPPCEPCGIYHTLTTMSYEYGYDVQGNISSQTDYKNPAYSISGMVYDGLDRLTDATGYWGDVSIGYDTLSNIDYYNFSNSDDLLDSNLTYHYNTINQLESVSGSKDLTFRYDNRGNVSSRITDSVERLFDFNRAGKISSSGTNSYVYDGHGRRVKTVDSTGTSYSLYSQSGQLLYREKDSQAINYIFLGKQQVARVDDGTQYIHTDLLGSPVVETDSSAAVIADSWMHYRPFGATIEVPKDEVGYTGHKFDTDLGLSYMQQRYYDPEIGRFYSNDPVGYTGEFDTFNRYVYVGNNPYKYKDPNGEAKKGISKSLGNIAKSACKKECGNLIYYAEPKQQANYANRRNALRAAKRDAKVPKSQKPEKIEKVKLSDENNQTIKDGKGNVVKSTEYTHTTTNGKTVVIQDHSAGHSFSDGKGAQGPHLNVRPIENKQTGKVTNTSEHYDFENK